MKPKSWDKDIVVSFACICFNKIEVIIESNHIHKISQCDECGKEYEVWAGKQEAGGD